MYGIAYVFFFIFYRNILSSEVAMEYLAGAVLLGAAPCTAMTLVWSKLSGGNPSYTLVQVATNFLKEYIQNEIRLLNIVDTFYGSALNLIQHLKHQMKWFVNADSFKKRNDNLKINDRKRFN